mmetsp:Transcript_14146/g.24199  ORF Transcript_14146/g.24199 Transcript_14146/m.24199 type:complete len:114 (-) Transcript_14146:972-1313(-)
MYEPSKVNDTTSIDTSAAIFVVPILKASAFVMIMFGYRFAICADSITSLKFASLITLLMIANPTTCNGASSQCCQRFNGNPHRNTMSKMETPGPPEILDMLNRVKIPFPLLRP